MGKTLKELNLKVGEKVIYDNSFVCTYMGDRKLESSSGVIAHYWGWDSVANFERLEGPKPKFKVGDKVILKSHTNLEREVVYVQNKDERIFYTVIYKGDIPTSHYEHELSPVPPKVKQESFVVNLCDSKKPTVVTLDPGFVFLQDYKISYNRVDGVVDVTSVKMEKLK
jgi:hypothetical protein